MRRVSKKTEPYILLLEYVNPIFFSFLGVIMHVPNNPLAQYTLQKTFQIEQFMDNMKELGYGHPADVNRMPMRSWSSTMHSTGW